jgi:hypothetical protein
VNTTGDVPELSTPNVAIVFLVDKKLAEGAELE